ncbi:YtpR family tRNA-binding protein [Candidatus Cytomitobacter primus]|uniref:phenylalanine--tRNA ligase n=1 Tax=Candidatus Cytomitobacter primus TaxID=2066024 RepID=A0A5C0UFX7_9PROT|nr:phenylalanine--tRNA ligase subunit beta [Candidatus Cytomitobacter primus]QEK38543.1 phenylalanine--tRNA ligase subunit beta [Candidatus Cytomitobacter primus]
MKFTINWIKDFYDFDLTNIDIRLVDRGFEIECQKHSCDFDGFKSVEIIEISKHPNADKLSLCTVKTYNNETYNIVCGASNLYIGMRVILATVGSKIPKTGMVLQKANIRGIESCGMLCSADELGLNIKSDGILDLHDISLDVSISDLLDNGELFDIEVTANRKDVLNIFGIAREISAGFRIKNGSKIDHYENKYILENRENVLSDFGKDYDIAFAELKNTLNGKKPETPIFIINRLSSVGINISSNCLENIVNYVQYIFGYNFFITNLQSESDILEHRNNLNGNSLNNNALGCQTEIKIDETMISNLKLYLFINNYEEQNLKYSYGDISNIKIAINYLIDLLEKYCGYAFINGYKQVNDAINQQIELNFAEVREISGNDYSNDEVKIALSNLDFNILSETPNMIKVEVPIWRKNDIIDSSCLIEEVIRYYGVDNIPIQTLNNIKVKFAYDMHFIFRKFWIQNGLYEVCNNSFMDKKDALFFDHGLIKLNNPMTSKQTYLRTSLISGLLHLSSKYLRYNWQCDGIFEIGKVFIQDKQYNYLSCVWLPKLNDWNQKPKDFFECKKEVEDFLKFANIKYENQVNLQNGCEWHINSNPVCKLVELDNQMAKHFKIKQKLFIFEINLDLIILDHRNSMQNNILSNCNVIHKDLSFRMPKDLPVAMVMNIINMKFDKSISIKIFDVYPTYKLAEEKSVGIRMIWEELDQTKTSEEIEEKCNELVRLVEELGCKYE